MIAIPSWVIDTNVLVSALFSARGFPAQLWQACRDGRFVIVYDHNILAEYGAVLHRARFSFPQPAIDEVLSVVEEFGREIKAPPIVSGVLGLPDRTDEVFLAVALAASDHVLVTGNARHFPPRLRRGVDVITPREAVARLG